MYSIFSAIGFRKLAGREAAAFCFSIIFAEVFYKFGSFTLECLSFLVTWFMAGYAISYIRSTFRT